MIQVYYDSKDTKCKSAFGAVEEGQEWLITISCQDGVFVNGVQCRFVNDDDQSVLDFPLTYIGTTDNKSSFQGNIRIDKAGLYWYSFHIDTEKGSYLINNNSQDYQLTVYAKDFDTPEEFKGGVIYHIFVDRFNKGQDKSCVFVKDGVLKEWNQPVTIVDNDGIFRANDFYGGNLQGIIDKLDYIQDLGVNILYLSPIFRSSSNHRYDTGDYSMIDELLGDEKSFTKLVAECSKRSIKIMLDGVFNHTGADSKYFNKFDRYDSLGAYQSKDSPYYDWFTFYDQDNYHCWWGVTVCPTVSKTAKGFKDLIVADDGVIQKWTKLGAMAWRLDVVDELSENFVERIRQAVKKANPQALLIGEVWEDASNKISYGYRRHYLQGNQLDGVMNYPFKQSILGYCMGGNANNFVDSVMQIVENYPHSTLQTTMNLIGSHDTVRAISLLSGKDVYHLTKQERQDFLLSQSDYEKAKNRLLMASALEFILPGMPSIYYGDEIGMQGYEDPLNRMPMTWDDIDNTLLEHYKTLGTIRKEYRKILCGKTFCYESNGILVVERQNNEEKILLIANNSNWDKLFNLESSAVDLMTNQKLLPQELVIESNSIKILIIKKSI